MGEMMKNNKYKKVILLTNIPAPYRLDLFKKLSEEFRSVEIDFKVWFMAETEPTRYWTFNDSDFMFPYKIFKGIHPTFKKVSYHFNIGVLTQLLKEKPDVIIIGGAWVFPTSFMSLILSKSFLPNTETLIWSESHLHKNKKENNLLFQVKQKVYSNFDGFIVPGVNARDYVEFYSNIGNRKVIYLPNTIDENKFYIKVGQIRKSTETIINIKGKYGLSGKERVYLLPARFIEVKGIVPFLTAIKGINLSQDYRILIVGDGPLRPIIENEIMGFDNKVNLLGQVSEETMIELYSIADILLLPSLYDPSPLSVIEASWAGLPLMLSNRVGNHNEALLDRKNGWLFNPDNPTDISSAFIESLQMNKEELLKYGEVSLENAKEKFDKFKLVARLVESLK